MSYPLDQREIVWLRLHRGASSRSRMLSCTDFNCGTSLLRGRKFMAVAPLRYQPQNYCCGGRWTRDLCFLLAHVVNFNGFRTLALYQPEATQQFGGPYEIRTHCLSVMSRLLLPLELPAQLTFWKSAITFIGLHLRDWLHWMTFEWRIIYRCPSPSHTWRCRTIPHRTGWCYLEWTTFARSILSCQIINHNSSLNCLVLR